MQCLLANPIVFSLINNWQFNYFIILMISGCTCVRGNNLGEDFLVTPKKLSPTIFIIIS